MGTGEESTAAKPAAPTASTQETPPTATYPDWTTQMQAYYGAAPPPPFFTSNVASSTPHPYVWGGQHLMPPYGTPIPYPGLYPHGGLYPHPGVPPPAPDAVKEIEGKGPDRKERGSTKKSKGNSGNAGLVVGKSGESAKLTSGSGNDGASQSADSGSEGVSQSSDENTNQREVGTKKKGFNQMLAEGANAQNNDTVGYSGAVVPATVPGNPVGTIPGTNLNMGMDLWNTSPVGTIPLRAATVPPKMVGREGVPADHDERELKRQKRKQSNRESARRSRLRKQAECEDLQSKVEILNNENHSLSDELQRLSEECEKLTTENKTLMEELNQLYGPDAVAALQGVRTNMLVQSVHGDGKGQDASIQSNNLVSGHPNGSLYNSNSTELGLTSLKETDDHQNPQNQSIEKHPAMENISPSIPGSNERIAYKLKSYFELGQEVIAKAVKAEEWGLIDDAITHYKNANRILLEAKDTRPPSYISSCEQEKVKTYYQKISTWQGQVSERLQVLSRRTASSTPSTSKTFVSRPKATVASSFPISGARRNITLAPLLPGRNNATVRNQADSTVGSKPARESGSYDSKLVEMIETAIVDKSPSVKWEDVAGLEKAKQSLLEMVIIPTQRPDLFPGGTIRRPPKGLLLFGPPGNGKTMLAKAVASESAATFFNISASSLTSKWVGEAEKLVRTLFEVAIARQPSVIFMDEIDSIMSTRLANENDASRRLKSEFLIQFDGVTSNSNDLVIVIGATNKPQELDDAVLRRLVKRIYVPLPDESVRRMLFKNKLKGPAFSIPGGDLERLVKETEGYSGSDLQALCEEAAMMPIRELGSKIRTVKPNQIRPLRYGDFKKAMSVIRPSLQKSKWEELEKWNQEFGSN